MAYLERFPTRKCNSISNEKLYTVSVFVYFIQEQREKEGHSHCQCMKCEYLKKHALAIYQVDISWCQLDLL